MLKPWMDQFSVILEPPMQPEDPDNWSLRMEVNSVFWSKSLSIILVCRNELVADINSVLPRF
jgi:hypothetical protein